MEFPRKYLLYFRLRFSETKINPLLKLANAISCTHTSIQYTQLCTFNSTHGKDLYSTGLLLRAAQKNPSLPSFLLMPSKWRYTSIIKETPYSSTCTVQALDIILVQYTRTYAVILIYLKWQLKAFM